MAERLARALALVLAAGALVAPAASAEQLTPQAADANAEFLAYAPAPPVPGRVCVVDTGVDLNTDAAPAVESRFSIYGGTLDDVGGDGVAKHGTYVAGIIASQLDGRGSVGIWPHAKIVSVRVFADRSAGSSVPSYVEALDRCRSAGATVVNLSLSGLGAATGPALSELENRVAELQVDFGINVVAAAGNSGDEIGYPGRFPAAFTVGATDSAGNLCSFSGRGPELDLMALGCDTQVSLPGNQIGVGGGTSYATPVVSAALAALRAYSPGMSAQTAEGVLLASARTRGAGKILDVAAAFHHAGLHSLLARPRLVEPPAARPRRTTQFLDAGNSHPLTELGVRAPRLRSSRYRRGVLRVAVSGVPDFGRAVFTVDDRRFTSATGRLTVRLRRAPRRVGVAIEVPGVGRTRIVHVPTRRAGT